MDAITGPLTDADDRLRTGYLIVRGVRLSWSAVSPVESGDTLVFIHGWAASQANWLPTVRRLGRRRRCLAFDLPGHGDSDASAEHETLDPLADLVADVVRELVGQPAILVGHSMGTSVAIGTALRHPEVVSRLVLVGPVHPQHLLPGLCMVVTRHWIAWPAMRMTAAASHVLGALAPPHGAGALGGALRRQRMAARVSASTLERTLCATATATYATRMSDLSVPVLFMVGEWDPQTLPAGAKCLAADTGCSRLVVFPRVGHLPMAARPDAFDTELERWLDEGSSA